MPSSQWPMNAPALKLRSKSISSNTCANILLDLCASAWKYRDSLSSSLQRCPAKLPCRRVLFSTSVWRRVATETMKAVVLYRPGAPESLQIEQRPIPKPNKGQVLIQVKAFGLNRSELFTRQGLSPNVKLPRVLGIEAVGLIHEAPGGEFQKGDVVATCMGGLGREVDGGYAEYTLVKAEYARLIETKVPWNVLGALPEMLQTSWGALNR